MWRWARGYEGEGQVSAVDSHPHCVYVCVCACAFVCSYVFFNFLIFFVCMAPGVLLGFGFDSSSGPGSG